MQRLVRELNESRSNSAYLRADLASSQAETARVEAENARLQAEIAHYQAENARFKAKYARLRAQLQAELLEDLDEDEQQRSARLLQRRRTEAQTSTHARGGPEINPSNEAELDEDEEEEEAGITVWINQDGDLETDSEVNEQAWNQLEAIWADQVSKFDEKNPNWASVNLKGKCLKTALFPRVQNWTQLNPGEYACRNCTNMRKICVGQRNNRLEALRLPSELLGEAPSVLQTYVADIEQISRKFIAAQIW